MVEMDEINKNVRLNIFEGMIEISNIITWECHEFVDIFTIHRDNNLFT